MDARQLINRSAYAPAQIQALGDAFDKAGVILTLRLNIESLAGTEDLRMRLANAVREVMYPKTRKGLMCL